MQTRRCPLCGLQSTETERHATDTHKLTLDAAEAILEEGRQSFAGKLERTAERQGAKPVRFEDHSTGGAMREGGYL